MSDELPKEMLDKLWALAKHNSKQPKGFHFTKTGDINKATHWLAYEDERDIDGSDGVTPYQFYRVLYDQYDEEHMIIDDNKNMSLIFLCHKGDFVILDKIKRV